ncbi:hypothetical protein B5K08_31595 [Rhizobium leguminosarum bv. trifolii]|uniref:Uncharacterized protein n=1 Tax=Rhizobium leguminosarum bv. trifolii TaxID=386 RepID=A0A3E1AZ94_RHILT|nr:hypothetical protein B5K10_31590 [Rhizobium leguminosarum bv. trifolii]RFB82751.1 hypothetical protein B5K08_31595 [Rhizobium leguminosarum bv. trifolii]
MPPGSCIGSAGCRLGLLINFTLYSASSSALCRGSAERVADARDKPEHDGRGLGAALRQQSEPLLGIIRTAQLNY